NPNPPPHGSPPGAGVTVAFGHASAGVGGHTGHDYSAGHGGSRKCLAPGSLAGILTKNPHRTHLDGARGPCAYRPRSSPLHSALTSGALAICVVRDRRCAHAGCGIAREPFRSRRTVRRIGPAL